MIRIRAAGRLGGRRIHAFATPLMLAVVIAVLAAACGESRPLVPTLLPSSSGASASPDASSGPRPTAWAGNAVLGIEALGAADGPILAAINDFNQGIANEDLVLMRRAADGLAGLDVLLPNMDKINIYEPMVPFAESYGAAIRGIVAAATAVRSAIDDGDAGAITTSSQALIASLRAYTDVQPELARWVQESIEQRRLLLR